MGSSLSDSAENNGPSLPLATSYRLAVIPGDGIGQEVVPSEVDVLQAVALRRGFKMDCLWLPWSAGRYLETGSFIPEGGFDEIRSCDAILFGAHGGTPGVPDDLAAWEMIFPLRQTFDQYVNLRPIRQCPGILSPLRLPEGRTIDMAIVRENSEGELAGPGGLSGIGTPVETASQLTVVTRFGTERVARFAFDLARGRRQKVTNVTKSNAQRHALRYWDRVIEEVREGYPDVEYERLYVDAAAAAFVQRPWGFDVVLATNLFGDILSDLGASLVGGLGMAPSGNLNPERLHPSMFEPVHGSAPDIAAKGIANPTAAILSGAMMLEHIGELEAAADIRGAVDTVLSAGTVRTRDLGGNAGTKWFTQAVIQALDHRVADGQGSQRII